jgi:hypothetical protein
MYGPQFKRKVESLFSRLLRRLLSRQKMYPPKLGSVLRAINGQAGDALGAVEGGCLVSHEGVIEEIDEIRQSL